MLFLYKCLNKNIMFKKKEMKKKKIAPNYILIYASYFSLTLGYMLINNLYVFMFFIVKNKKDNKVKKIIKKDRNASK